MHLLTDDVDITTATCCLVQAGSSLSATADRQLITGVRLHRINTSWRQYMTLAVAPVASV